MTPRRIPHVRLVPRSYGLALSAALGSLAACSDGSGPSGGLDVSIVADPAMPYPGDTVGVLVQVVSAGGGPVVQIKITADGLIDAAESVLAPTGDPPSASWLFPLPLQAGEVVFTGSARAGTQTASERVHVRVYDSVPPEMTLPTLTRRTPAVPGDTVQIAVTGSDLAGIRWVGYRVSAPVDVADSVSVLGKNVTQTLRAVVDQSWDGTVGVVGFVRDYVGNLATRDAGTVWTVVAVRRPVDTLHLEGAAADLTAAQDGSRLYLSQYYLGRIAVVLLDSVRFGPAIELPSEAPWGLDVTPDGNTLVAALNSPPARLGLTDLTQPSPAASIVGVNDTGDWLNYVGVTANGTAILGVVASDGTGGRLWEYDLAADTARERTDAGPVELPASVRASGDRMRVLLTFAPGDGCFGCAPSARVYYATADTFSASVSVASYSDASADSTGSRYLIGTELYDGSLNKLKSFSLPDPRYYNPTPATAMAPNGQHVYLGNAFGFGKVGAADGTLVEQVVVPFAPTRLWVLPGENVLIALRDQTIAVVRLR